VKLVNKIPKEKLVLLLGGNNDKQLCQNIIEQTSKKENIISLCGKVSLLESANLMRFAKMNFVCDSAPLHLCSATNAPVTAVFCSTLPEFGFSPLSNDARVVQTKKVLACRPCGLHGYKKCPQKHFDCGYSININELIERL
jgi:heptosyltransferase-2